MAFQVYVINRPIAKKFGEDPMFIFLPEVNIMMAFPKICLVLGNGSLGIFYKLRKLVILYDKCIEKSIVVCTQDDLTAQM